MSASARRDRPWWRRSGAAFAGVSACAVAAAMIPGAVESSAAEPAADSECPDPFPMSDLSEGMEVDGLTVSQGTTPDELTGEVVGTINDGIAPGVDMIMVDLSGSQITDPDTGEVWRGIWAGMSGSPVYAPDGRLIGAVAYGLGYSPSTYAGVTPAEDMYSVRDYEADDVQAKSKVQIPPESAQQLRADGDVSQQAIRSGYRRLPMPLATSGLREQRLQRLAAKFDHPSQRLTSGSSASAAEDPIPIEPGGNMVASMSYGDVTQSATGTATAVCDEEVLGFGHPAGQLGRSTYSMHGADAVLVETDLFGGSFKVANPAAPSGQITQDRLAGILGVPDATPEKTTIDSDVSASNGNQRDGTTTLTETMFPDDVAWIAATHLLSNEDRVFDAIGSGTAKVGWTVQLERPNGTTLEYSRSDVYADDFDVTFSSTDDVYSELARIQTNRFADVRITDVEEQADLDDTYKAFEIGKVQRHFQGKWVNLKPGSTIRAKAGSKLVLRTRIVPQQDSAGKAQWRRVSVPVGPGQAGRSGQLTISGGANTPARASSPQSLPQLLSAMKSQPKNDRVVARLDISTPQGTWHRRGNAPTPFYTQGSKAVTVNVRR